MSVAIQFTQNFLGVQPKCSQVCKFVKDFRPQVFGVCAAGVKVSCELVEVASYLTALGKQGGNGGQGFFAAACNDDCFLDLDVAEKQLASIEYWIMGSLNGISIYSIGSNVILCAVCLLIMFLLYRQIIMLSLDDAEGQMLGVHVNQMRMLVLLIATLATSSVISMTGLISFISLLAPHGARMLLKNNRLSTMLLSGLIGGCLLTFGDILARSVCSTELPVSIFTSIVGAPFLIYLCIRRKPVK